MNGQTDVKEEAAVLRIFGRRGKKQMNDRRYG